jgi:hypothetical protein
MTTQTPTRRSEVQKPPRSRPGWVWLWALPVVVFLGTFGFWTVDRFEVVRAGLTSGRSLLITLGLTVGTVGLTYLLWRFVRWAWVAPVVLTGVVLVLAAWQVLPSYVDETDNTRLVRGPLADASEVEDAAPDATASTAPPAPVRVSSGTIEGIDHDASGAASLIRNTDGSYVVRFEMFNIEGSPDPIVYLIEGADREDPGGINLGAMRGNVGDASDYAVPAGTEPGAGWTILVWCGQFAVPIANATQAAV